MAQSRLGLVEHRGTSPSVVSWSKEVEPKLRAAAMSRMFFSTKMLALRNPQLNPIVAPVADGYAVFHGPGAMSSFAREIGTSRPVSENELCTLEKFYADRGCSVRLWVSDRTHTSLVEMLHERGYSTVSCSINWLRALEQNPVPFEHRNIEVLPVVAHLRNQWIETVATGFFEESDPSLPSVLSRSFVDLFFALGCAPDDQAFLARKHDEYVGGAVLNVYDGLAMLRTASTRFARRNTGVHQALLATRLRYSREQGAEVAVSQTPPVGPSAHNMRKLGFEPFSFGYMMEKNVGSKTYTPARP
jgi:hypothetical protein